MSEKIDNDHIATQTQEGQSLHLHKIYLKDVSFESPNSPLSFTEDWKPEANFDMHTQMSQLPNGHIEVVLAITLEVKNNTKTAYLVEVVQAGIFELIGYSEEETQHILGSYAPNTLYPFAREVIANLTMHGGFAPYLAAPVNFDRLFYNYLQEQEQEKQASAE